MKRAYGVAGVLTIGAAALALAVNGHPGPFGFDVAVTRALQRMPFLTVPMNIISAPGNSVVGQSVAVVLICALMAKAGWRREGKALLTVAVGEFLLNALLKLMFHRPRPTEADVHVFNAVSGFSFPSGHVMFYTAFYGGLFLFAATKLSAGAVRTTVMAVCAMLVGVVGMSRMYLGAHWASDVTAAYSLGAAWLLVAGGPLWRSTRDAESLSDSN
jgi:membrane-associated phospholipid phosphatase